MYYRFLSVFLSGALLLFIAACSDPASVGDDLGGGSLEGGAPETVEVTPADAALSLDTVSVPSRTGGPPLGAGASPSPWRFLAGTVEAPLAGRIATEGYVDFLGSASNQDALEGTSASDLSASLRLTTTYLHGDSTASLSLEVFTLANEVDLDGGSDRPPPADTSFDVRTGPVDTYSVSPTDSLITLSLPQDWIDANIADLRDSTRVGFKLQSAETPTTSNRQAVVGFEHGSATLRVQTAQDTVDFSSRTSFTHIDRRTPPTPPDGYTLLQDGIGTNLVMNWAFDRSPLDTLAKEPLNQAAITIPVDTAALESEVQAIAGPDFAQPIANGYRLSAIREPGTPECRQIGLSRLFGQASTCVLPTSPRWAPDEARAISETAFTIFDGSFRNSPLFTTLRGEIAVRNDPNLDRQQTLRRGIPSTLPVLVRTEPEAAAPSELPRAILTITPL